ncbi:hypothetical protein OBBRIDRAFT_503313 [Obba rivulosa]|uniref:Uncharacterized protein n=1 Tax=Obba rivulosa TaxID=1052685 RepID=A0A8E2J6J9_9APHY|nr:hypothetical protein OBBRIDRAFT_503313 [Obba rivulosa]
MNSGLMWFRDDAGADFTHVINRDGVAGRQFSRPLRIGDEGRTRHRDRCARSIHRGRSMYRHKRVRPVLHATTPFSTLLHDVRFCFSLFYENLIYARCLVDRLHVHIGYSRCLSRLSMHADLPGSVPTFTMLPDGTGPALHCDDERNLPTANEGPSTPSRHRLPERSSRSAKFCVGRVA